MAKPEFRIEILDRLKVLAASLPADNILTTALVSSIESLDLTVSSNTYRDIANSLKTFLGFPDLFVWADDIKSFKEKGQESGNIQQIERAVSAFRMMESMCDGNLSPLASSMLGTIREIAPENEVLQGNTLDWILLSSLSRRIGYDEIAEKIVAAIVASNQKNVRVNEKKCSKNIAKVLPDWFLALKKNFRLQTKS